MKRANINKVSKPLSFFSTVFDMCQQREYPGITSVNCRRLLSRELITGEISPDLAPIEKNKTKQLQRETLGGLLKHFRRPLEGVMMTVGIVCVTQIILFKVPVQVLFHQSLRS